MWFVSVVILLVSTAVIGVSICFLNPIGGVIAGAATFLIVGTMLDEARINRLIEHQMKGRAPSDRPIVERQVRKADKRARQFAGAVEARRVFQRASGQK